MNKFFKVKISDIGQTITGKTPSSNDPEDFGSVYMFVTPSDSFDKKMMNFTQRYLSVEGVEKLSNKLLPPKSIMVTCIGSAMGKVAMNETSCITNQQINSIVPNKRYDSDYIYYATSGHYKLKYVL
jgi:type I restriction enzyme S subunit